MSGVASARWQAHPRVWNARTGFRGGDLKKLTARACGETFQRAHTGWDAACRPGPGQQLGSGSKRKEPRRGLDGMMLASSDWVRSNSQHPGWDHGIPAARNQHTAHTGVTALSALEVFTRRSADRPTELCLAPCGECPQLVCEAPPLISTEDQGREGASGAWGGRANAGLRWPRQLRARANGEASRVVQDGLTGTGGCIYSTGGACLRRKANLTCMRKHAQHRQCRPMYSLFA